MTGPLYLRVEAQSDAGLLARLIGRFAQRDMDILALDMRRWREDVSEIRFTLICAGAHSFEILVARIEQVIGVGAVSIERSALAA